MASEGVELAFTVTLAIFIVIVSLGLGSTIELSTLASRALKPRAILTGFCSQYGFMPLFCYCLALMLGYTDYVAIGAVLLGCSPGGSTSNLFTQWIKGNLALSITMTLASTLAACFMIPLLALLYIETTFSNDGIEMPWLNLIGSLFLVLFPCSIGIATRHYNTEGQVGGKFYHEWLTAISTVLGAIFLVVVFVVGLIQYWPVFLESWTLWVGAVVCEPVGCAFGFYMARCLSLTMKDCRTVAMETGVQNSSLTIAIVGLSFSGSARDKVLLFPLAYSVLYVVHSVWLVLLFRHLAKQDEDEEEQTEGEQGAKEEAKTDEEQPELGAGSDVQKPTTEHATEGQQVIRAAAAAKSAEARDSGDSGSESSNTSPPISSPEEEACVEMPHVVMHDGYAQVPSSAGTTPAQTPQQQQHHTVVVPTEVATQL